jgi:hypothetical protein
VGVGVNEAWHYRLAGQVQDARAGANQIFYVTVTTHRHKLATMNSQGLRSGPLRVNGNDITVLDYNVSVSSNTGHVYTPSLRPAWSVS